MEYYTYAKTCSALQLKTLALSVIKVNIRSLRGAKKLKNLPELKALPDYKGSKGQFKRDWKETIGNCVAEEEEVFMNQ